MGTVTGASAYDWEDLAYGPCADECRGRDSCGTVTKYCLYIADIGDHDHDGAHDVIYMVREPTNVPRDGTVLKADTPVVDKLTFSWTELDAETLMVTPNGQLYVVSKIDTGRGMIAQIPDSAWGSTIVLDMGKTGILKIETTHHDHKEAAFLQVVTKCSLS